MFGLVKKILLCFDLHPWKEGFNTVLVKSFNKDLIIHQIFI